MRPSLWMCALACATSTALAQEPSAAKRPVTKADSTAADSIALVREMEKLQAVAPAPAAPRAPSAKIAPDISVVGDLVGDLSPDASTQESGARLGVREIELAIQSVVDPYFRGDVYLGFSDVEGARIEQAFLTTTALPWGLQARLGRFLMPVGKQTTTHRHDLHTIEYPWVIQRFLGAEGLKGTGFSVSKVLAPFGFYQELQLSAVDRFGEKDDALQSETAPNKQLDGMGYAARLRNYWDLSQSTNVELSASAITGKREQPALAAPAHDTTITAVNARQSVVGADLTFRWRPLQQGLYKSFILQAEVMHQQNERINAATVPGVYQGPNRDFTGGYVFARWQVGRRLYVGGRFDSLQDPDLGGGTLTAGSGVLEFFPSEFSKLVASFERLSPNGGTATNRLLLQATFAVGPHKPHPF
ncbi:MAG: hypothetical protein WC700_01835 [Gemmatimonadaceae bacterium]